jgi:hypothetical protein
MKADRIECPEFGVNQIAKDEKGTEEAAMLFAPNDRKISGEDFSNLRKIV